MSQYNKKHNRRRRPKLVKSATKLLLNLAVLAGLGMLIRYGYLLFTHKVTPLIGSIVFIVGIAVWVILIRLLRSRYKWTKPSFKLTAFSVIAILLIFTFAGVQPLATYKDDFFNNWNTSYAEWAEKRAEEAEIKQVEKEIQRVEKEQQKLNKILALVNEARQEAGLRQLVRSGFLDKLAKEHCEYMKSMGDCNHDGFGERASKIGGAVGENVADGYYSESSLVNGWLSSPGHRENIMTPYFTRTGIGYVDGYATQIFSD